MNGKKSRWNDTAIESIMGTLLRSGVLFAAGIVLLGGVLYLHQYGFQQPHYAIFKGEPAALRHLPGIVQDGFKFHSHGVIQLGLVFLIATPVARVMFSVFAFIFEKDGLYVAVTLIVLSVLLFSLSGGHL